jgi:hypothetical protein
MLHYGTGRDFFGPLAVSTGPLRAPLDVLVLALFFLARPTQLFASGHDRFPPR